MSVSNSVSLALLFALVVGTLNINANPIEDGAEMMELLEQFCHGLLQPFLTIKCSHLILSLLDMRFDHALHIEAGCDDHGPEAHVVANRPFANTATANKLSRYFG